MNIKTIKVGRDTTLMILIAILTFWFVLIAIGKYIDHQQKTECIQKEGIRIEINGYMQCVKNNFELLQ